MITTPVYAEVSPGFDRVEDLEAALPTDHFERADLPWTAAFLAGKAYLGLSSARRSTHESLTRLLHRCPCGHRPAACPDS